MHLHGIRVGQCAEAELKSCQRGGGSQREICLCSQELNILCLLFVVVVALVVNVVVFRCCCCCWGAEHAYEKQPTAETETETEAAQVLPGWAGIDPAQKSSNFVHYLFWSGLVCSAQLNGQVDALIEGAPLVTSLLPALLALVSVSASF